MGEMGIRQKLYSQVEKCKKDTQYLSDVIAYKLMVC